MVFLKFIYSEKATKFWTAKSTDFALAGSKMAGSGSGEPERLVRNLPDLVLRGTCQKLRYTLMEWMMESARGLLNVVEFNSSSYRHVKTNWQNLHF